MKALTGWAGVLLMGAPAHPMSVPATRQTRPIEVIVRQVGLPFAQQADVTVVAVPEGDSSRRRHFTLRLDQGRGALTIHLAQGSWTLGLASEEYWSAPQDLIVETEAQAATFLVWPTGRLTGTVRSVGAAVLPESLLVEFSSRAEDGAPSARGSVSCPLRDAAWSCRVPAGTLDLQVVSDGAVPIFTWDVAVAGGGTSDVGAIPVRVGASVAGWIYRDASTRLPAIGVSVRLALPGSEEQMLLPAGRSVGGWTTASTDARGFFQLAGSVPGDFILVAEDDHGYSVAAPLRLDLNRHSVLPSPLTLLPPASLEVAIDPPLSPSGRRWQVTLLGEGNHPEVLVREQPASVSGIWTRQRLRQGRYRLLIGLRESNWYAEQIEVAAPHTTVPVWIRYLEVQGSVRVGDEPVRGTLSFNDGRGLSVNADSDEEGRFSAVLPRADDVRAWEVEVKGEQPVVRRVLEDAPIRETGPNSGVLDITLPNTRVSGLVVDESGQPAGPAIVTLQSLGEVEPFVQTTARDDGAFALRGLAPGRAVLSADAGDRGLSDQVEIVAASGSEAAVRLVVRRTSQVNGQVVSTDGPVSGAQVIGYPSTKPLWPTTATSTDTDGQFVLHLPPDTREAALKVSAVGHALRMGRVPIDAKRPLMIALRPVGGTLILDAGNFTSATSWRSPMIYLLRDYVFESLPALRSWSAANGQQNAGSGPLVVPQMEEGDYVLCVAGMDSLTALTRGAHDECVGGHLKPGGELSLTLNPPSAAPPP